jgi:hypothetical protein
MQTFLPFKSFTKSAQILDSKRLNKQILEGYQILKVLGNPDPKAAWRNHPAVKMWRDHEVSLYYYVMAMAKEADLRGIKTDKNRANIQELKMKSNWNAKKPKWYADPNIMDRLTESHRANLYRKDPEYYGMFRNDKANPCCPNCQYYWIAHTEKKD